MGHAGGLSGAFEGWKVGKTVTVPGRPFGGIDASYFAMRVVPVSIAEPGMNVPRTCEYPSKSALGRFRPNRSERLKTAPK
jgi:hypothetical protein